MQPKTIRRDRRGEPTGTPEKAPDVRAASEAASPTVVRRDSPDAPRPSRGIPTEPVTPREPHTRLETGDLMALVDMDPREIAALMNESIRANQVEEGARVTGRITRVGRDDVYVDLGGKSEGQIDRQELPDAKAGDEITAYILENGEDGIILSLKLSGNAASEHLEQAKTSGVPVEGKVMSRNAGGFEVRVGGARAFCPASQMSRLPDVDPDTYVGQTLSFRVLETGDKIVVSRRAIQEEEAKAKAEILWQKIAPGDEFRGIVRNVLPFGAFVDIGGLEGLVPRREMSWAGGDGSALRPGQAVEVRVLEADLENRKLTLSARSADDDPWNAVGSEFHAGGIYKGKVVKLETFGAFVELAPGLQGLAHSSRLRDVNLAAGDQVDFRLVSIDHERKRLELAPAVTGEVAEDRPAEPAAQVVQGTVMDVLANGVAVRLADGRTGWLAAREVDLPAGTVLTQRFRKGKAITARVLSTNGERVDLTTRMEDEDKNWRSQMRQQGPASQSGALGTFADLLKGFKPKK